MKEFNVSYFLTKYQSSKQLKRLDLIPGCIYSTRNPSTYITISKTQFFKFLAIPFNETIMLKFKDGKKYKVSVQRISHDLYPNESNFIGFSNVEEVQVPITPEILAQNYA